MSKFNERLFARLDAAAEHSGVPAYARGNPKRRHLRWLPIAILLVAIGAMGMALVRPDLAEFCFGAMMFAFAPASVLQLYGPVKSAGTAERLDEFDRAVRSRAYLATYAAITFAAMACVWLIVVTPLLRPVTLEMMTGELRTLSFFLLTLFFTLPTLHASWTTRPIAED